MSQFEFGNRKCLHPRDLNPLTPKPENQERYLEALYSDIPIVLGTGFAGTGKTALSIHAALNQVFDSATPYSKLIIIRNIVESSQSVGFLKGSLEEKVEPYLAPYKQLAQQFLNFNDPWQLLVDLENVEFMVANFIRGQTFDDCIILVDEAQNFDYSTLKDIITRAGYNCKIVLCGDIHQDDLKKIRKESGLSRLCNTLTLMPYGDVAHIEFELDDIVRSSLVKNFLIADYEYERDNY